MEEHRLVICQIHLSDLLVFSLLFLFQPQYTKFFFCNSPLVWIMVCHGLLMYGMVKLLFVLISTHGMVWYGMVFHGLKIMNFNRFCKPPKRWFPMVLGSL